jgi:hypothetical protein
VSSGAAPADLGFLPYPPGSEVDDGPGPSILTRSDGPGCPVPIWPARPLAGGPGRSVLQRQLPTRHRADLGRPSTAGPGLFCFRPVHIFFQKNSCANYILSARFRNSPNILCLYKLSDSSFCRILVRLFS